MKIKEYIERINNVEHIEREYYVPPLEPENYILLEGIDDFGERKERRVKISYKKPPLGTGNLGEHRNPDFSVEMQRIKNEKRRLGI